MTIEYRPANKTDCRRIAELDYVASGGAAEFLFHDLVPGSSPVDIVASGLEDDSDPHSYRNVIVAETDNRVIGMALSFPARFHGINDEMKAFFPADRLEHFKDFFAARVENSYLLDAICVNEGFRGQGVGERLLELTIDKARTEGFSTLSLIVFADNHRAISLYTRHGFSTVEQVPLEAHELIPHHGGCLLMGVTL